MTTQVNHKQLKKLLKIYYKTKTPLFVWGTMGIGKSMVIREVAKDIAKDLGQGFVEGEPDGKENFGFVDVRISQLEPSDLRGLPNIVNSDNSKVTKWIIPNWLPSNKDSCGILFFDELNLAPPLIQASAYQLVLDRRVGDYKLPDGWFIISAGNTSSDKASVYELSKTLSNRFTHLGLKIPNKDDWVEWALKNNIDSSIISFIEWKPSWLYKFDRNSKDEAFPTPRSWSYVSKLISEEKVALAEKEILTASAVGEGVAIEFYAFLKLKNQLDITEILKNPSSVADLKEIDVKYTLLSALVDRYKEDGKKLEKVLEVCHYLEPEFAIILMRFMKNARQDFKLNMVKIKIGLSLLNKYSKYLVDTEE